MFARTAFVALLAISASQILADSASAQGKPKDAPPKKSALKEANFRTLSDALDVTLDTKELEEARSLKSFVQWWIKNLADRGIDAPILVDKHAFLSGAEAGAPDPYILDVSIPSVPAKLKAGQILRQIAAQAGRDGTFLIRNGAIEITTAERASPERLLGYPVTGRFDKKPLEDAIDALCEMSGATIIIDTRVGDKARAPVSATFRNNITLEAAVRLLAEMADLQADIQDNVLFITSKPKADGQKEKTELRLKNRRLDLAVRDLAAWSGKSVILDPAFMPTPTPVDHGWRLKAPGPGAVSDQPGLMQLFPDPLELKDLRVTATFPHNVSVKVAAEIIARQVHLAAVVLDNVIYITHPYATGPLPNGKSDNR